MCIIISMNVHDKYLMFASQADIEAEAVTDPVLREHYVRMALRWRDLANYVAALQRTPNRSLTDQFCTASTTPNT